jgi:hypothetical protein
MTFILSALVGSAQNGGQSNENSSVKIEQTGFTTSGKAIIKVSNKQTCPANIRLSHGNTQRVKSIHGVGNDTFQITVTNNTKIQAKTETNCGSADFGQVELRIVGSTLPVKFTDISGRRIDDATIQLTFKAEEDNTIKHYVIMVSFDGGKTYTQKMLVFPNGIDGFKTYTVTLKK